MVLLNFLLTILGLVFKEFDYSYFHFTYEPIAIKILSLINLPAIILGGLVGMFFDSSNDSQPTFVIITDAEFLSIVIFSILQWLIIGYVIYLCVYFSSKKVI